MLKNKVEIETCENVLHYLSDRPNLNVTNIINGKKIGLETLKLSLIDASDGNFSPGKILPPKRASANFSVIISASRTLGIFVISESSDISVKIFSQ